MADAADKADELLRFLSRAGRLEALPRTGWLVAGIEKPESVAAHTYEVALVALWLADNVEAEVDAEKVLRIALLHDVGEALLTDLPGPVKDVVGAEEVEEAEAEACREILEPLGGDWTDAPRAYREQDSTEARLVKAGDRLQMLAKSLTYDSQSRGDVRRFWENTDVPGTDEFPLVREIYERLKEHWENGDWYANDLD